MSNSGTQITFTDARDAEAIAYFFGRQVLADGSIVVAGDWVIWRIKAEHAARGEAESLVEGAIVWTCENLLGDTRWSGDEGDDPRIDAALAEAADAMIKRWKRGQGAAVTVDDVIALRRDVLEPALAGE